MNFLQRAQIAAKAAMGIFSNASLEQAGGLIAGMLGAQGSPPVRGTQSYLKGYASMPWMRGIAGKIAYAVASTQWQLLSVKEQGSTRATKDVRIQFGNQAERKRLLKQRQQAAELKEIEDHPFLDLINDANSFHTGLSLRKLTMIYLDLVGDSFWLKQRNALGAPIAAWPIPPHWISKVPTVGAPYYELNSQGKRFHVDDTEMLWMSDSNPENPYGRGVGHMQSVSDELEIAEYGQKMIKQVFFNKARPDLLVMPKEGTLQEGEVERLEQRWSQATQGFWRAFRPFFMRKAVDVKVFEQNFQNVQMTQLQKDQRDTIMQVFGIPPEIMGVLENSNRATIDAAEYLFNQYVVVPRLEFLRQQLQARMIPEYDDRLILEYISPSRSDKTLELSAMKTAPWAFSIDEWREVGGFEEKEDGTGTVHMVPANLFAVESFEEEEDVDADEDFNAPDNEDEDEQENEEEEEEERAAATVGPSLSKLSNKELKTMRKLVVKIKK
jgi:HK97 family phage portal protein